MTWMEAHRMRVSGEMPIDDTVRIWVSDDDTSLLEEAKSLMDRIGIEPPPPTVKLVEDTPDVA